MQDLKKREFLAGLLKAGALMSLFPIASSQLQSSPEVHPSTLQSDLTAEDFKANAWFWLENRHVFSENQAQVDPGWKLFLSENRPEIDRIIDDRFREVCRFLENYYSKEDLTHLHAFLSSSAGQKFIRQLSPEWQNKNLEAAKELLRKIDSLRQNQPRTLA